MLKLKSTENDLQMLKNTDEEEDVQTPLDPFTHQILSLDEKRQLLTSKLHQKITSLESLHGDLHEVEVVMDTCQQQMNSVNYGLDISVGSLEDLKDLSTTIQVCFTTFFERLLN